jgi:hypothetical protein
MRVNIISRRQLEETVRNQSESHAKVIVELDNTRSLLINEQSRCIGFETALSAKQEVIAALQKNVFDLQLEKISVQSDLRYNYFCKISSCQ